MFLAPDPSGLLTASQERPAVNYFGIEIVRKYQLFTANRLAKRNLTNVRLACADAREFLRNYVPAGSVSLSLRLTFQALNRTLTDAEVQQSFDAILAALVREHAAVQR